MMSKIMPHHLQQLQKPPVRMNNSTKQQPGSFQSILNKSLNNTGELKISKHAEKRIQSRGIEITPETWEKIKLKVHEAGNKGVNDSLVVTSNAAFVVNAKNKTVITAMDRQEAQEQMFTNINGAILIDD